jgi:hypothetical protein
MARSTSFALICLAIVISLIGWGVAWAQDGYSLTRYTIASSNVSSGGDYAVRGTTGQAVTSSASDSTFAVKGGYWLTSVSNDTSDAGSQMFLPALER